MFVFSLCNLSSEKPKPSKHQELIPTLQESALKKSGCGNNELSRQSLKTEESLLQLLMRYFGEM